LYSAHDLGIYERIHLGDDAGRLAGPRVFRLAIDHLHEPRSHVARRHQKSSRRVTRETSQRVEEIRQVDADLRAGREQTKVGVNARRLRVVVTGSKVGVSPDSVVLLPHNERGLGVDLQARQPVRDVDTEPFEGPPPGDVVDFVEACLQLDENRYLLSALRRLGESTNDLGISRSAIERHLDGEHIGICCRRKDEMLDRRREESTDSEREYPTGGWRQHRSRLSRSSGAIAGVNGGRATQILRLATTSSPRSSKARLHHVRR
jgi:hypothetical protein